MVGWRPRGQIGTGGSLAERVRGAWHRGWAESAALATGLPANKHTRSPTLEAPTGPPTHSPADPPTYPPTGPPIHPPTRLPHPPEPKPAFLAMLASWPVASLPCFCRQRGGRGQNSGHAGQAGRSEPGGKHYRLSTMQSAVASQLTRTGTTPCACACTHPLTLRQFEQLQSPRQRGQRQSPAALAASTCSW